MFNCKFNELTIQKNEIQGTETTFLIATNSLDYSKHLFASTDCGRCGEMEKAHKYSSNEIMNSVTDHYAECLNLRLLASNTTSTYVDGTIVKMVGKAYVI